MSESTIVPAPSAAPEGFWASKRRNEKITKITVYDTFGDRVHRHDAADHLDAFHFLQDPH